MNGFPLLLRGMQNGGIQHSTMLRLWWVLASSVFLMPWQSSDGMHMHPQFLPIIGILHLIVIGMQGTWCVHTDCVVGYNFIHSMANG